MHAKSQSVIPALAGAHACIESSRFTTIRSNSFNSPYIVSHHFSLIRPGHSGKGRLPPSGTTTGAYDYAQGPTICVTGAAPILRMRLCSYSLGAVRTGGQDGPSASVYSHDPYHVAATVPWCLIGSDSHGTAQVVDMGGRSRYVPSGHNSD